jgi:hypothetical protein
LKDNSLVFETQVNKGSSSLAMDVCNRLRIHLASKFITFTPAPANVHGTYSQLPFALLKKTKTGQHVKFLADTACLEDWTMAKLKK